MPQIEFEAKKLKCGHSKGREGNDATGTLIRAGGGCTRIQPFMRSWAHPSTQPLPSCTQAFLEKVPTSLRQMCSQHKKCKLLKCLPVGKWIHKIVVGKKETELPTAIRLDLSMSREKKQTTQYKLHTPRYRKLKHSKPYFPYSLSAVPCYNIRWSMQIWRSYQEVKGMMSKMQGNDSLW